MVEIIEDIVAVLKAARHKKGLSQRELSARTRIPQNHISKIEKGKVDLQVSSLIALARALDLELVFVSKQLLPAVQSLQKGVGLSRQVPMYQLPDDENED